MAVRNGGQKGWSTSRNSENKTSTASENINLDRADEALFALGLGVVDEFMAAGFSERDAWQAASTAVDAAVARLDQVAARLIGGRA
ncbi:hypothetical protein ABB55_27225 [Prosthecomicrobium hirschii]|uniref:Uncharacterized protein n=2 Tax=Prosthecodimorpha hirschii TaxID=665126 RepID=A0A0P6VRW7_9HYPH|nr:hypothetical protein ABB55_27225 [Prosthecomicrobium hirschii]